MTTTCPTCHRDLDGWPACKRLACIWAERVTFAHQLDPDKIREAILETHDRLPGGSSASETGIGNRGPRMEPCEDHTCPEWHPDIRHDHPVPSDPTGDAAMRPSRSEADLKQLQECIDVFVLSVGKLLQMFNGQTGPTTWHRAVGIASHLANVDAIEILEVTGRRPRQTVLRAGDQLSYMEHLRDRHCAREANDWERTWTSGLADEDCCIICISLGLRVESYRRRKCPACYRLWQDSKEYTADGEPVDPPPELIENLRRIGSPGPDWKRARSEWLRSLIRRTA